MAPDRPSFGRKPTPPAPESPGRPHAWYDPHSAMRLFNADTRRRKRRLNAVGSLVMLVFGLAAAIYFVRTGLTEVGLYMAASAISPVTALLYALYSIDWPQPPLTCEWCGSRGWHEDLRRAGDKCPVCGGLRFTCHERGGSSTLDLRPEADRFR